MLQTPTCSGLGLAEYARFCLCVMSTFLRHTGPDEQEVTTTEGGVTFFCDSLEIGEVHLVSVKRGVFYAMFLGPDMP